MSRPYSDIRFATIKLDADKDKSAATVELSYRDGKEAVFTVDRGSLDNEGIIQEATKCIRLQLVSNANEGEDSGTTN